MPGYVTQNMSLEEIVRTLNQKFYTAEFEPDYTGTNVTSAYGKYQRVGDIVFVMYRFIGTNVTFTTSNYITLPIKALNRKNNATELFFPSSNFDFNNSAGTYLSRGHQIDDTNRIAPDTNSVANEMIVSGYYFV